MEWLGWALKSIFHLILTFYMYYDSISAVALTSVWYAINMFCKINEIKHQLNVFIIMIKHLLNSLRMLITQRMNHLRVLTSTWKSKFILDWNSSPQVSHFICQNKVSFYFGRNLIFKLVTNLWHFRVKSSHTLTFLLLKIL